MVVPVGLECEEGPDALASPACAMPTSMVLDGGPTRAEILQWRKSERERLIGERLALGPALRRQHGERIAATLDALLPRLEGSVVSLYWPFRGEPDLRDWAEGVYRRGGRCVLPVVVAKATPLVFRAWRSGDAMERSVWNIPIPAEGEELRPDIVIAPLVGFDRLGYRLGYGGGFFDRTLAGLAPRPRAIGVGYALAAMATIHPLAHDIGMNAIVTEDGLVWGSL